MKKIEQRKTRPCFSTSNENRVLAQCLMELSYQTLKFTHQAREAVRNAYIRNDYTKNPSPTVAAGRFRVSGCYGDRVRY
ncbi:hypothetical protein CR201_G0002020 [Pongo abelii]|uniref:Uncharacterized protein n=1 Tax=Pongo abelii TaxID=9601 RepID=A0A2J8XEY4_PONAB|nr:hypothetical protein CR201_G0002020 [Pongo abelii]